MVRAESPCEREREKERVGLHIQLGSCLSTQRQADREREREKALLSTAPSLYSSTLGLGSEIVVDTQRGKKTRLESRGSFS